MRWGWHHNRAADFFLLVEAKERAITVLETGLARLESEDLPVSPNADPMLLWKRKRVAEDIQRRRLAFLQRINNLKNSEPEPAK
jgi:hypothetical protein